MSEQPVVHEASDGVSKALLSYRELTLQSVGFPADKAAELAPTMSAKLRTEAAVEALALAREAGVYRAPEPPEDPDAELDAGELAEKYGRRNR